MHHAIGNTIGLALAAGLALAPMTPARADDASPKAPPKSLVAIPADKDTDIKFYTADGAILTGSDALARMGQAGLTL
jgi:hypothetical protein